MRNKVITTIVIRPLDDPTWYSQSVVADLAAISKGDYSTHRFGVLGWTWGLRDVPIR